MKNEHCMYYLYHDGGYYKDADGNYTMVDNFGKHDLRWCIDYVNRCRKNSSPPKPRLFILKIKQWQCGKWQWVDVPVPKFKATLHLEFEFETEDDSVGGAQYHALRHLSEHLLDDEDQRPFKIKKFGLDESTYA